MVSSKAKHPFRGACFLLDRGARETIIEPPGGGHADANKIQIRDNQLYITVMTMQEN